MLFRTVDKPAPALLPERMNETACDGLGEYLVAGIKSLCGHDLQGKLTGIERATGERFLA
jgi:hypothetical protein